MKVALIGAYGFNNAGDNFVAIATEHLLKNMVKDIDVNVFSLYTPNLNDMLCEEKSKGFCSQWIAADFRTKEFWEKIYDYDALIIGGGGILIPLSEFEPFILAVNKLEKERLPKVAWNAIGSQFTPIRDSKFFPWYRKVKKATEKIDYISVRSDTTKRLLKAVGCDANKINLVPDPVVNLSYANERDIQEKLRVELGISTGKKLIGISIGPELNKYPLKDFTEALGYAINNIKNEDKNIEIVIFPFGIMYGDLETTKDFHDICKEAKVLERELDPEEIWGLVGMLDTYLTLRYHGAVAGISHGVPTIILDCYLSNETLSSKLRDLAIDNELENYYMSPIIELCGSSQSRSFDSDSSKERLVRKIESKIYFSMSSSSKKYWEKVSQNAKAKSDEHFNSMLKQLELI